MATTHCKTGKHQTGINKTITIDWDAFDKELAEIKPMQIWTTEAVEMLKRCYGKASSNDTAKLINKHLGTDYTAKQVRNKNSGLGLSSK